LKRLIVNADDFGRSDAINQGIIAGHQKGIVTSASLMTDRDAFDELQTKKKYPRDDKGNLIEGDWRGLRAAAVGRAGDRMGDGKAGDLGHAGDVGVPGDEVADIEQAAAAVGGHGGVEVGVTLGA
jgi:hypothetical protein